MSAIERVKSVYPQAWCEQIARNLFVIRSFTVSGDEIGISNINEQCAWDNAANRLRKDGRGGIF